MKEIELGEEKEYLRNRNNEESAIIDNVENNCEEERKGD